MTVERSHIEKTRAALAKCLAEKERLDEELWIVRCAIKSLYENLEYNLLKDSGLEGHLVESSTGDRFIVKEWREPKEYYPEEYSVISGAYINRKGAISPTWIASDDPAKVKDLGPYEPRSALAKRQSR